MATKFEVETYATDAGNVISKSMINLPECTIDQNEPATRVRFMVALLESYENPVWCLFYEQGGDWASFGDGDENNSEMLSDWMPDAVRDCVAAVAKRIGDSAAEDMEWFTDWANAAESTMKMSFDSDASKLTSGEIVIYGYGEGNSSGHPAYQAYKTDDESTVISSAETVQELLDELNMTADEFEVVDL